MNEIDLRPVFHALAAAHRPVGRDKDGLVVTGGFSVTQSMEGGIRVTHALPTPEMVDDQSDEDDLAAMRQAATAVYAATLTEGGWNAELRRPHSRYPYVAVTV